MFSYPLKGKTVLVAGHRGMVGSALVRRLKRENCIILTVGRAEADLTRQAETEALLNTLKPDAIIIAAAKVGGIFANAQYPAEFMYDNLMIATNLIHSAHITGVERLLFLGSSCIYPKFAPQPITENALLTGPLEPTNEAYAIAKIAGIKLAQYYRSQYGHSYISAMPTNLYGVGDNFDLETSHVLPALIRKAHDAKISHDDTFKIWGTGTPRREFLYADDCADALVFLLKNYEGNDPVNVGYGEDVSILELAEIVKRVVGYKGKIMTDLSKPDGTPRKLMSADTLRQMGWQPKTKLEEGIAQTYDWFLKNKNLRA